jgi:molybdenum cofactor synthesis domain-containing protein
LFTAGVITVSDKGSRGEREDKSGPEIARLLSELPFLRVAATDIVPDEVDRIRLKLTEYTDEKKIALVVTTGGTGVSPRDVTPEATLSILHREVPGMAEAMRRESAQKTPHAMISRAVVGIRGASLIINLPGSPGAARENLAVLLPALKHALEKIQGDPSDCAS